MASVKQDWRWWLYLCLFSAPVIPGLIISIIHTRFVYLDLKSSETKKPVFSKLFSITLLTSLWLHFLGFLQGPFLTLDEFKAGCDISIITMSWRYIISKMFMYLAFIIRICSVHNNPLYQYNLTKLKIICFLTIIYALALCVGSVWFTKGRPFGDSVDKAQGVSKSEKLKKKSRKSQD